MRVNLEDSLTDDGHARMIAKIMGWDEDRVIGKLYWVYRDTQKAKFVEGPIGRAVTLCVLRFDSDDECQKFLSAMVTAQLSKRDGDTIRIRGNERRVTELDAWYGGKVRAGKASANKRKAEKIREQEPTDAQQNPTVLSPKSLVLSPIQDLRDPELFPQHEDRRVPVHSRPAPKARKPVTEDSPLFARVVDCWFVNHREVYGGDPPWGSLQGKQLSAIMRKARDNGAELLQLIPQFFHGPYPDSTKAGHPLSDGYASLAMRIDMLRADMTNPNRRVKAAVDTARLQQLDTIAQDDDMLTRMQIQQQLTKDPFDDRQWRTDERRSLEQASPSAPGALEESRDAPGRDSQPKALASGDHRVVPSAGALGRWQVDLASLPESMRSGADAVDRIVQATVPRSAGASEVSARPAANRGPTNALGPGSNYEHAVPRVRVRVDGE
jgi:hypothetical protein